MSRPETHRDLPVDEHWEVVGEFTMSPIAVFPDLLGKYATFVGEAQDSGGLITVDPYDRSRVKMSLPVPQDQLDYKLRVAQTAWDNTQDDYQKITEGVGFPEWRVNRARKWAADEGLEPPQPPPAEVVRDLCAELCGSVVPDLSPDLS